MLFLAEEEPVHRQKIGFFSFESFQPNDLRQLLGTVRNRLRQTLCFQFVRSWVETTTEMKKFVETLQIIH